MSLFGTSLKSLCLFFFFSFSSPLRFLSIWQIFLQSSAHRYEYRCNKRKKRNTKALPLFAPVQPTPHGSALGVNTTDNV